MKNYNIFLIFAQNIDCVYTLEPPHYLIEAVLMSIHNLCFRANIRKMWGVRGYKSHGHVVMMTSIGSPFLAILYHAVFSHLWFFQAN